MAKVDGRSDPFHLKRFVEAQAPAWERVRAELVQGEKQSHWMWFIFPQIRGLGTSFMAQRFAISGLAEASAYLAHPLLGPRLRESAALVNTAEERSIHDIFGTPDDLKFHSSMTLFAQATPSPGMEHDLFTEALARYFDGVPDAATIKLLQSPQP